MPQTEGQRNQFVDFRALRKSLSFAEVLKHYGVEIKHQKGNRHVGFCPLPTHQGKKRSPSFSAKLDFGVWHCFGCRASGNLIEFAVRMEGLDPTDKQQFRQVALKLQEVFGAPKPTEVEVAKPEKSPPAKSLAASPAKELPVVINEPLNFVLKNLDQDHPYLKERGFTPETIRSFGLGYCSRALMSGRVVIPIHDEGNRLVGYAGRLVCDNQISEYHPKYRLPAPREREGRRLEFRKSLLVYNANWLREPVERLIVVEGFPSVWWLTQHGYSRCGCGDGKRLLGGARADHRAARQSGRRGLDLDRRRRRRPRLRREHLPRTGATIGTCGGPSCRKASQRTAHRAIWKSCFGQFEFFVLRAIRQGRSL
jgi:DNA primase